VTVLLSRALLDTLLDSMDAGSQGGTETGGSSELPSSSQTARVLNLLAFLLNQAQAAVKAALLYLPQTGSVTFV